MNINIGTDCQAGISVSVQGSACTIPTPVPGNYDATCTLNTRDVDFDANSSTSVPSNSTCTGFTSVYTDPEFTFNP